MYVATEVLTFVVDSQGCTLGRHRIEGVVEFEVVL